jgi:hypothetical protein
VVRRCRKLGRDVSREFRKAKHLKLRGMAQMSLCI